MSFITLALATVVLLFGTFFLSLFSTAFRRVHKKSSQKLLKSIGGRFFYRSLHNAFFDKHEYEGIFFGLICTLNIIRFAYAAFAILLMVDLGIFPIDKIVNTELSQSSLSLFSGILFLILFAIVSFLIGDYIPRVLGTRWSDWALRFSAPIASFFMTLVFPITYLFLSVLHKMSRSVYFDHLHEPTAQTKQEIIDIVQETDMTDSLDNQDKKLISSVLKFKEHLAREIMVPRVDVFGVTVETTIKEAAAALQAEGYSRVPVYKGSLDNIIGILMYKDVLQKYMEYEQNGNDEKILAASIETIMKAPLYTPETKKISNLLQEFRKKQVHIAIVVDEYGGTEGLVTIEDILEQIVGEIADEYDDEEESFFTQTEGGWIVDARMSIMDAEEQLGIRIPQEGDYDTISGYIYHVAGTIPSRGFAIHNDEFELVVLRSSERLVEKVRIKPTPGFEPDEYNEE